MTHASWNNEQGRVSGPGHDNERLEYLGDAVLELIVGEYLFRRFPGYDEGQLTQLRAALVNTMSLARLAEKLELGDALLLGKGAAKTGASRLPSLLANAFEAMIGAIFLDQGYRVATRVFLQNIGDLGDWTDENYKGRLQEAAQERTGQPPSYRVQNIGGPGHRRLYSADAVVGGEVLGTGTGATKQAAEQASARAALETLKAPRARRRVDQAGRAVAAAKRAAGEAAGDTPRSRRRIAEAAVDRDAVAATARTRPARVAPTRAAPPAGELLLDKPSAARSPASPVRRRGFLSALRNAAEVLVGRRLEDSPPEVVGPPPPPAPGEIDAAEDHHDPVATPAQAGRPRTRRGRRGGRGRRRSPAAGDAAATDEGAVLVEHVSAPAGPRAGRAGQRPRAADQVREAHDSRPATAAQGESAKPSRRSKAAQHAPGGSPGAPSTTRVESEPDGGAGTAGQPPRPRRRAPRKSGSEVSQ